MRSIINWIKSKFNIQEETFLKTETLNLDDYSGYIKVEQNGLENGKNNYPPTDSKKLDAFEASITSFFIKRLSYLNQKSNHEISSYNTSTAYPSLNAVKQEIESISNKVEDTVTHTLRINQHELKYEKKHLLDIEDDFHEFKKTHSLKRIAEYPDSRFLVISIAIAFWLFETLMNGFFFAKGSDLGLLGGWSDAAIVSFVNIFLSFLIGNSILRLKNHILLGCRVFSWMFMLFYALGMFIFNLSVGHYRDMVDINIDNVATQIIPRLLSSPFAIEDIFSWLLVLVGCLFSILSLIDGYKSDDPYFKYGKKDRDLTENRELYRELVADIANSAEIERNSFVAELEQLEKDVKSEFSLFIHIKQLKDIAIKKYHQEVCTLIEQANSILKKYRQYNMMNRTVEPPNYFKNDWKPNETYELLGQKPIDLTELEKMRSSVPLLIRQSINDIRKFYIDYFEKLHEVEPDIKVPTLDKS